MRFPDQPAQRPYLAISILYLAIPSVYLAVVPRPSARLLVPLGAICLRENPPQPPVLPLLPGCLTPQPLVLRLLPIKSLAAFNLK